MSKLSFYRNVLAGLLLFGAQFLGAQTVPAVVRGSVVTTGIVGVTGTQTARLNVLNLQPVIPGVAAVACPATLEFFDETGALLKQLVLTNISPANSASLVFKPQPASGAANARSQIRAAVFTPSAGPADSNLTPASALILLGGACSVMPSLEIIDDLTGDTHTFTTEVRPMSGFRLLPVFATGLGR